LLDLVCICDDGRNKYEVVKFSLGPPDVFFGFVNPADCIATNPNNGESFVIPGGPNPVQGYPNEDGSFSVKSRGNVLQVLSVGTTGPANLPTDLPTTIITTGTMEFVSSFTEEAGLQATYTKVSGRVINVCEEVGVSLSSLSCAMSTRSRLVCFLAFWKLISTFSIHIQATTP
jgi:hypothetical protein